MTSELNPKLGDNGRYEKYNDRNSQDFEYPGFLKIPFTTKGWVL